ncbi:hypothetical protein D3C80_1886860 [compost metagenome]
MRHSSTQTMALARAVCAAGSWSILRPSLTPTRLRLCSTNKSIAPCRAPIAEDDTARTKICPNGRRNNGALLTALPGLYCMKPSTARWVR